MSHTLYTGASLFGGEIQALVAEATGNAKTGPALTLWVLPATADGEKPWDVIKRDGSVSTCGDCPQQFGGCYTHAGSSQTLTCGAASLVKARGRDLEKPTRKVKRARSAAFGDAAALPLDVLQSWRDMRTQFGLAPLGYTHAWRRRPDLQIDHMASVESVEDAMQARAQGWRYFRVRPIGSPILAGEIQCPAADKKRTTQIDCNRCGLCDGLMRGAHRPSITIEDHGPLAKIRASELSIGRKAR